MKFKFFVVDLGLWVYERSSREPIYGIRCYH